MSHRLNMDRVEMDGVEKAASCADVGLHVDELLLGFDSSIRRG
jgi:hypothetical protein